MQKQLLEKVPNIFIVTSGNDKSGRAGMAFAQAAHSAALELEVMIFLVLDGAKWAYLEYGKDYYHECFDSPIDNLKNCIDLGVKIISCATCHDQYKTAGLGSLREGIEIGGFNEVGTYLETYCNVMSY